MCDRGKLITMFLVDNKLWVNFLNNKRIKKKTKRKFSSNNFHSLLHFLSIFANVNAFLLFSVRFLRLAPFDNIPKANQFWFLKSSRFRLNFLYFYYKD